MQSNRCLNCQHYWGANACDAFPDQIPTEILTGKNDHTEPFDGDGGIQFKEIKKSLDRGNK